MKDDIFTVKINEIELEVHGGINQGESGNWEQPPVSKSVDINKVFYKGVEVSDLLDCFSQDCWNIISEKILENE